jgi:3'(2'), 5'-bisphosphate nucleotidase
MPPMTPHDTLADWLPPLRGLARQAGELVMRIYAGDHAVRAKADASPVTMADELSEAHIVAGLRDLAPDVPIVAEEAAAAGVVPEIGRRFWLVDPLDGTREFVRRNGEFTVNIALVEDGRPLLGIVLAPALGDLYWGVVGAGAGRHDRHGEHPISCRRAPPEGLTVLASRSHGDEAALARYLAERRVASVRHAGSSLKLCLLAAGEADLYPRFGRTMEWDIAAGHAVLAAAGGQVLDLSGAPLGYGKPGFENPDFVARGLAGDGPVPSGAR